MQMLNLLCLIFTAWISRHLQLRRRTVGHIMQVFTFHDSHFPIGSKLHRLNHAGPVESTKITNKLINYTLPHSCCFHLLLDLSWRVMKVVIYSKNCEQLEQSQDECWGLNLWCHDRTRDVPLKGGANTASWPQLETPVSFWRSLPHIWAFHFNFYGRLFLPSPFDLHRQRLLELCQSVSASLLNNGCVTACPVSHCLGYFPGWRLARVVRPICLSCGCMGTGHLRAV